MLRQKMPRMANPKYWKSYSVHWCFRSAMMVSAGEKDVCRRKMFEAGDCPMRSRALVARHFRRTLCGTRIRRFGIALGSRGEYGIRGR
jgi:hypothetical protein